jgi:hypothetical protein
MAGAKRLMSEITVTVARTNESLAAVMENFKTLFFNDVEYAGIMY